VIKSLTVLLALLHMSSIAQSESTFGKSFITGLSLTYIWDYDNTGSLTDYRYNEYTWNLNAAVSISKRIYSGVQVMTIFISGTRVDGDNYSMYGLFGQYNFTPKKKSRFFIETSFNQGNYCTCGKLDPYKKDDLLYWGLGIGLEKPLKSISKSLYLDLSFVNYTILDNLQDKYNYTQYIIGLNYRFGKFY